MDESSPPGLEVQGGDVDRVPAGQQWIVSLIVGDDAEHVPGQLHLRGIVRVVAEEAGQRHPLDGGQLRKHAHMTSAIGGVYPKSRLSKGSCMKYISCQMSTR